MSRIRIKISCCLCNKTTTNQMDFPTGWKIAYENGIEEDLGFCPTHAPVELWREENCSDCSECWGSCSLWKAFAYRNKTMKNEDYKTVEEGFCPKKKKKEILLVKILSIQRAGYILAKAIKQYGKVHKKNS